MSDTSLPTPSPAVRRDGLHALMLVGIVVLALVLGYRPGTPAPVAAAAPPADGRADPGVIYAAPEGPAIGPYDLNRAMALAGEQVPPEVESYYFFAFVDEAPAEQEIAELAAKLRQASKEHDYLGISGPDAERNRRNLLSALKASQGSDLAGVVIIFVGPREHRDELTQAVESAGAQLRFVVYPDAAAIAKPQV